MGKLRDEIVEELPKKRPNKLDLLIARLSDADRADLEACFADPSISTVAIHSVLRRRGFDISYPTLQRIRKTGAE